MGARWTWPGCCPLTARTPYQAALALVLRTEGHSGPLPWGRPSDLRIAGALYCLSVYCSSGALLLLTQGSGALAELALCQDCAFVSC